MSALSGSTVSALLLMAILGLAIICLTGGENAKGDDSATPTLTAATPDPPEDKMEIGESGEDCYLIDLGSIEGKGAIRITDRKIVKGQSVTATFASPTGKKTKLENLTFNGRMFETSLIACRERFENGTQGRILVIDIMNDYPQYASMPRINLIDAFDPKSSTDAMAWSPAGGYLYAGGKIFSKSGKLICQIHNGDATVKGEKLPIVETEIIWSGKPVWDEKAKEPLFGKIVIKGWALRSIDKPPDPWLVIYDITSKTLTDVSP